MRMHGHYFLVLFKLTADYFQPDVKNRAKFYVVSAGAELRLHASKLFVENRPAN